MNNIYKTILSNEQINDPVFVKKYLQFSFNKRQPEKDKKLYINICKIYGSYPDTIKELLVNIPKLGYYKDYFHILKYSENNSLSDYIFELIIAQIKEDISQMKNKAKISTLGKYLPREKSKLNIKINFIDKFCNTLYPNINQFTARRKYRKLKTELNQYLGTLEAKLATKKYDEINFNKVSPYALKKNMQIINNHETSSNKFKEYLLDKLKNCSLTQFISYSLSNVFTQEEINKVWEYNRFLMDIPTLSNELVANSMCIIDLSKDTFTYKFEYFTIGLAILIDQFSLLKNKIIIAGHGLVNLDGKNVTEKAEYLMKLCGPVRKINLEDYVVMANEMNNGKCNNLIFVTSKDIGPINYILEDNKLIVRQYIPDNGGYNVLYYNGNNVKRFYREVYSGKELIVAKNIDDIIVSSNELNDFKMPVYIILFFLILVINFQIRLFF
ncbi:hypothetical protein Indivirus_12_5 [Indivirus ILV1]|uniref:Uncharacterized protein n=1 Tax=Indivirus ILV1 TaxID=1977633 RepID=A0A1V0SEC8_9VIRU|nr:hypothetical protein Indivirus_12_5 [Indivirus ILV1]